MDEVMRESACTFVERLMSLDSRQAAQELRLLQIPYDARFTRLRGANIEGALRDAGLPEALEPALTAPAPPENDPTLESERELRTMAWRWLESARPGEAYLRRVVLPFVERGRPDNETASALRLLGGSGQRWAVDELLRVLREAAPETQVLHLAMALAETKDKRVIPWMIAAIAADNTHRTIYGVGWFGLNKLTFVEYDPSHDGEWWLAWWDANRKDLPPDAAALDPRALVLQFRR